MEQTKRLGRGLESLLSVGRSAVPVHGEAGSEGDDIRRIPIDHVRPNRYQPRETISEDQLAELCNSIKTTGLLQPIVARQTNDGGYEIIAGERRWRASKLAGLDTIPAIIRQANERQLAELALVENIFREDLNAVERARAYRRYCDEFQVSAEEVASRLGENRTTVVNYLRLLTLPDEVKNWLSEGKIAMGHARALLGASTADAMSALARLTIERDLSVRAVEQLVREGSGAKPEPEPAQPTNRPTKRAQLRSLEETFTRALETKFEIQESRKNGSVKITIHYYSLDDFDRIADKLNVRLDQ